MVKSKINEITQIEIPLTPTSDDMLDDSSLELPSKEKPKKEKKPFVMTPARTEAFQRARDARDKNRETRKLQREEQAITDKKEIEEKIVKKASVIQKKKQREHKLLEVVESDSSDSEPEIIIQKIKKPKKKVIVVESDSEDEIIIQKRKVKQNLPQRETVKYAMYV
jgi:hypothetical protein